MKANKYTWFVVVLAAILIAALLAVGLMPQSKAAAPTSFASYQDGKPFRMVVTNQEVPVVKIMIAGFLQACSDYGLKCQVMGVNGNDIAGSVQMTEQSVALGSSGILATVYDKAWYGPVGDAIKSGIPVVNGHFPMANDTIPGLLAWVAPDNTGYAITSADAMAKKISCTGKVAITQSALNDGENAVNAAFRAEMAKVCPSVVLLDTQLETTDPAQAIAVTSSIIKANPDLTGAFSTTGGGATAWATSAKENGLAVGKLVIIGMDASQQNLDLVKSGEVYALVGQPEFQEMYESVVLLLDHRMGLVVPYANTLPSPLIFKNDTAPYYDILKKAEAVK